MDGSKAVQGATQMSDASLRKKVLRRLYPMAERVFRYVERPEFSRGSTLLRIPPRSLRGGGLGTTTYGEWCYTVGQFQSLIGLYLPNTTRLSVLDVGCGVGRLYLATKPYLKEGDDYTGIDITERSISICRSSYPDENVKFIHTPAHNASYAKTVSGRAVWPFPDASVSLVTALSVWTHLSEADWRHYLAEVSRVMMPGARAIITFFILDDFYNPDKKTSQISSFYPQPQNKWIFDNPAYDSQHWRHPSWTTVPETAIGVEKAAFNEAVSAAGLRLVALHPGQWKDHPGLFFQDIAVFEKT
jgi:SAM-dependent methyltransferase